MLQKNFAKKWIWAELRQKNVIYSSHGCRWPFGNGACVRVDNVPDFRWLISIKIVWMNGYHVHAHKIVKFVRNRMLSHPSVFVQSRNGPNPNWPFEWVLFPSLKDKLLIYPFQMCVALASLACLITSLINIYFISVERKFFERVFVRGYSIRSGDSARLGLLFLLGWSYSSIF